MCASGVDDLVVVDDDLVRVILLGLSLLWHTLALIGNITADHPSHMQNHDATQVNEVTSLLVAKIFAPSRELGSVETATVPGERVPVFTRNIY